MIITLVALLHIVEDLRGTGPLTSTVVRTEEEVPVVAGIEDAVEDSPLAGSERASGHEDGDRPEPDDSDDAPRGDDPKER